MRALRVLSVWGCAVAYLLPLSQGIAADTTIIAAFGDSLTAGLGVASGDSFPAQLEQKLTGDGYKVRVLNDGVSGDTTADGLARLDALLLQKPELVIIELGDNDLLRGLPPAETRQNLDTIMKRLHAEKIPMLLTGQQAPFTMGISYANAYNAIFPDLAKTYGAALYPSFLAGAFGKANMMQPDGIHPTKMGVATIVNSIAPLVEKQLKK